MQISTTNKAVSPQVAAVVLAAGKGTRMKSDLPKVLHKIGTRTLLDFVTDALIGSGIEKICVVLGGNLDDFSSFLASRPTIRICRQLAREGTADAVASTFECFRPSTKPYYARGEFVRGEPIELVTHVLICLGDTPALTSQTLSAFIHDTLSHGSALSVLAMKHPSPTGYGRLITTDGHHVAAIVEEKNADAATKKIDLCNTGVIFANVEFLFKTLGSVQKNHLTHEFYLTDCIEIARQLGEQPRYFVAPDYRELDGINDPDQLKFMTNRLISSE